MNLDKIINQTNSEGYKIKYNLDSSIIKTKQGDIRIILKEGQGQAHCFLLRKEIHLFKENKDIIRELLHEKDHFEILPYDLISFGLLYGGAMIGSICKTGQTAGYVPAIMVGLMELTTAILGGLNLYSDGIIYSRKKLKLGSFQKQ